MAKKGMSFHEINADGEFSILDIQVTVFAYNYL